MSLFQRVGKDSNSQNMIPLHIATLSDWHFESKFTRVLSVSTRNPKSLKLKSDLAGWTVFHFLAHEGLTSLLCALFEAKMLFEGIDVKSITLEEPKTANT
jgi:hypothetical protein